MSEREGFTPEQEIQEGPVVIPEIPEKYYEPGSGNLPDEETWKNTLDFVQSEFVLTYIWASAEKQRVRDEMRKRALGSDESQSEPIFHLFNAINSGTVTPDSLEGKENVYFCRDWQHYTGNPRNFVYRVARNPDDEFAKELLDHMGSREDLFRYFIERPLPLENYIKKGDTTPPEEYRSMLRPDWQALEDPQTPES